MKRQSPSVAILACLGLLLTGCAAGSGNVVLPRAAASPQAAAPSATSPVAASAAAEPGTACSIPDRFRGKDVERLPVQRKLVALTFDGGANADAVDPILRTLGEKNVTASFFLTGDFVKTFPRKSARIARSYLVGNHTMTHPDLVSLDRKSGRAAVRSEILRAQAAIIEVTGQDPRRFFRFPFGAVNARVISVANNNCYVPFRWTVDSLGWKGTSGGMSRAKVVARVVGAATPGEIVLMHVGSNPDDGTTLDAAALPAIITQLRAKGYSFVPLSRVMSAAP